MLIMIRRLRDISIEKFLDPNMPYPHRIKENMQKYLYAVFSPYKLKKEAPPWFKRHFNHLYSALPISLVGGAIGFISSYLDHRYGLVNDIIGGGVGVAGAWLFFVMMGCMMIGITNILRELSKEFKNSNEAQSFASVVKIEELKVFPLNILYSYTSIMISFPAVIRFLMTEHGPWIYCNIFILMAELSGFLIILVIPNYYVHLVIKSVKDGFKEQRILSIRNLENKIRNESANELDLKKYEVFVNMIERSERVKTWPFDFESVTKIVIMGIAGSIPTILQIVL